MGAGHGQPGERLIVKLAYDSRREIELYWYRPAAYGWISFKVEFRLPHIGNAGSYHLDVVTPGPLRVIDARMRLYPARMTRASRERQGDPFGEIPEDERELRKSLNLHERANEWRHGTFYAAGPRDHTAVAWLKVLVDKEGYIRGAFIASAVVTTLMATARFVAFDDFVAASGAVTVLLFLPGLLGYLVIRTGEHVLARGFLSGVRKVVLIANLVPITAAVAILLSHGKATPDLKIAWAVLLAMSAVATLMLLASSVLPPGVLKKRRVAAGPDESPDDVWLHEDRVQE